MEIVWESGGGVLTIVPEIRRLNFNNIPRSYASDLYTCDLLVIGWTVLAKSLASMFSNCSNPYHISIGSSPHPVNMANQG